MIKLETIYKELNDIIKDDMNVEKAAKLRDKIEQAIREDTCYKTTKKTRVNAIKRVAGKDNFRPALTGYGIYGDFKIVTDSYHLIKIKEDNMPLKLVTTDDKIANKIGRENCIYAEYPHVENVVKFNKSEYETIELNYDDIMQFYKLHKNDPMNNLYNINGKTYNIIYLKDVIDVIGKDTTVYQSPDNEYRPLWIENKNEELGIVLPVKNY